MDNNIFELLKDKIPHPIYLKTRWEEDFLVVSSYEGELYFLNYLSGFILENCNGSYTIDTIKNKIMESFEDVVLGVVESDLLNTIRQLQWMKLVGL